MTLARVAVLTLAAIGVGACAGRCGGGDGTTKARRTELTAQGDAGFLALTNGGASTAGDDAPLVVAVHGRGDTPESFSDTFDVYRTRARIVLPRGPMPYGEGYAWFELGALPDADTLTKQVEAARDALHARIAEVAKGRRYAFVGFSQGGFLAFAFAAKYPAEVACALPIAGMLPPPLYPPRGAPLPPVLAFHGVEDGRVGVAYVRATVAAFVAAGGEATLTEYPALGHTTSAKERGELYEKLDRCLETLTKVPSRALPSGP